MAKGKVDKQALAEAFEPSPETIDDFDAIRDPVRAADLLARGAEEKAQALFRIWAQAKTAEARLPAVEWSGLPLDDQAAWRALARRVSGVHE